jgi:predicted HTH transcriptional regulator
MARNNDNILTKGWKGAIGKEMVFREFNDKTVSGKFPDMSSVKPSKNQTKRRGIFAEAVKFARSVNNDPAKKEAYKNRDSFSAYHAAIKEFMARTDPEKSVELPLTEELNTAIQSFPFSEAQLRAIMYINEYKKITNRQYQKMNGVSKATATRHLAGLTARGIISSNGVRGAGASYLLALGKK